MVDLVGTRVTYLVNKKVYTIKDIVPGPYGLAFATTHEREDPISLANCRTLDGRGFLTLPRDIGYDRR